FENPADPSMAPLPRLDSFVLVVRGASLPAQSKRVSGANLVSVRAPPCLRLGRDRREPALVQFARELSIDTGPYQSFECMRVLKIFALAAHRAVLGQESFLDNISKQF